MRLRKMGDDRTLLIVEGSSDKSALMRWLAPSVHVVPAAGKEQVALSRTHLSTAERIRCTMIVDCDGVVEASWLGSRDLIVTERRDLEADLIGLFPVVENLVFEHGWGLAESKEELVEVARILQKFATALATVFGVVRDTARNLGIATRVEDPLTGDRRRLALTDIGSAFVSGEWPQAPNLEKMVGLIALQLDWSETEPLSILLEESRQRVKPCRSHLAASCEPCSSRRFANGHDLVDALSIGLQALGIEIDRTAIAKDVRLAATNRPVSGWTVLERLERRQADTGLKWLAT